MGDQVCDSNFHMNHAHCAEVNYYQGGGEGGVEGVPSEIGFHRHSKQFSVKAFCTVFSQKRSKSLIGN